MNLLVRLACFVLLIGGVARADEESWERYVNPRFGYELKYPKALVPEKEPEDGVATGSRLFKESGGKALLQTNAHFLHGKTLDTEYKEALERYGDSVRYKVKKDGWFVVSGAKDGTAYYYKYFVQKGNWASFYLRYPVSESKKWNAVVERIGKDFKPFLTGGFDRLEE